MACPNCGYCPHCGRGGRPYRPRPLPYPHPHPGPYWIESRAHAGVSDAVRVARHVLAR